jgi:putative redox protein
MKVTAAWQGKRHFVAKGDSGHEVAMDAKEEAGGENKGSRPMELLLMGLAGCTGIDVTMILEKMRQPLERLTIDVVGVRREEYPQAFTEIHVTYRMDGAVEADKAWRAIQLSEEKYCSATASLNATVIPHLVLNGQEIVNANHTANHT